MDYNKCQGCLKCVEVCEHGAIEVIAIEKGNLTGFHIDREKCTLCNLCLKEDFCFQTLFELSKESGPGPQIIQFRKEKISNCFGCLRCFKNCPNNAIIPDIV